MSHCKRSKCQWIDEPGSFAEVANKSPQTAGGRLALVIAKFVSSVLFTSPVIRMVPFPVARLTFALGQLSQKAVRHETCREWTASSQKSRTTLKFFDDLVSNELLNEILGRRVIVIRAKTDG